MGRPTKYNEQIAKEICRAVATNALSLPKIVLLYPHFPDSETIYNWRLDNKEFAERFMHAKAAQMDAYADSTIDIADDGKNDTYIDENGQRKVDYDVVSRARLRIDTRKWYTAKLAPKIYGDRTQQDVNINVTKQADALEELKLLGED